MVSRSIQSGPRLLLLDEIADDVVALSRAGSDRSSSQMQRRIMWARARRRVRRPCAAALNDGLQRAPPAGVTR